MLDWFDAHPYGYWALAWSVFSLLALAGIGPAVASLLGPRLEETVRRFWPRWLFVTLVFLAFFAFRWPLLLVREELNPDESQLLAGGITLQSDPIYWRSVDGTTHGPLDAYPLLAVRLVGLPINYGSARLIGALLLIAAVLAVYRAMAAYFGEALGRLGCLPAFCFFAFNTFWDFVHYSSEHVPVCLLAVGTALLAIELADPAARRSFSWRWLGGGLCLGAVPLAKLQGAPVAAALLATAAVIDLFSGGPTWPDRFRRLGLLVAAALAVPVLFALVTLAAGQGEYAWRSYIVQNIRYTGDPHFSHADMVRRFWDYAKMGTGFFAFSAGAAAFIAATILRVPGFSLAAFRLTALGAVFLLSSLAAVLAPGRQYTHYLILLVIPAALFAGCLFAGWWQQSARDTSGSPALRWFLLLSFLGLLLWPQIQSRASEPNPFIGKLGGYARAPESPVVHEILRYARRGEALGHWGWMCRYYVLTGMRQATPIAHTTQEIQYSPQVEFYRAHYLAALERSRPPVFIDTVGPGNFTFQDRAGAHDSVPAVRDFIAANYRQVADTDGTRVYVRIDRLARP